MKKLLLYLLCALSCNLDSMNLASRNLYLPSLDRSQGISGTLIAERCVSGSQPQIDSGAKVRLQLLLDREEDGLHAKLRKVIPIMPESGLIEDLSLQEVKQRASLKKREFEETCRLAMEDVKQRASVVLKDYPVDADGSIYEEYLTHEYAQNINHIAQNASCALHGVHQSQLREALQREKVKAKVTSRPFKFGTSLFTNVAKDVREDLPQAAAVAGACAIALPYAPVKTREKVEEGLGTAIATHPGKAATSLAGLFVGWQAYKYLSRYWVYREKASNLDSQVKFEAFLYDDDAVRKTFVDYQVPLILQSAREGATIARLEHQVQSLAANSAIAQQLLEQQGVSLQSLHRFADAHGISLQDALRRLDEVRSGQGTIAAGLGLLQKQVVAQRKQLQDVSDNVQEVKSGMEEIKEILLASHSSREHRSASDVSACAASGGVAALLVQNQVARANPGAFFMQQFGINLQSTRTASARNVGGIQPACMSYESGASIPSVSSSRVLSSQGAPVVPKSESVKLQ